ncbi:Arc family DNA-binding protein [Variovorax paradoxus]|nr:Arc family DNA-binding protein [Variovorax paradoxus]
MSQELHPIVRLQLRLPARLAESLRQQATENRRSLNNEMVSLLDEATSRAAKKAKAQPRQRLSPL